MRYVTIISLITAVFVLAGCSQPKVTAEKHQSQKLKQEIPAGQAMSEAQATSPGPDKIESGPMEVHREETIEKVESSLTLEGLRIISEDIK